MHSCSILKASRVLSQNPTTNRSLQNPRNYIVWGRSEKIKHRTHALRGNRTPGGSMATTQVTTTPLMLDKVKDAKGYDPARRQNHMDGNAPATDPTKVSLDSGAPTTTDICSSLSSSTHPLTNVHRTAHSSPCRRAHSAAHPNPP